MKNAKPIFIGGCDRSGTTLLGAMLGAHPAIITVPESQFIVDLMLENNWDCNDVDTLDFIRKLNDHWRFKLWDMPLNVEDSFEGLKNSYPNIIRWIVCKYSEKVGKADINYWVDHTPTNLQNGIVLLELFSNAKFIHLIRDGRAVANSIIPLDWGPNTIIWAANWWKKKVAIGLAAETFLQTDQIHRVYYEDLVLNPRETIQELSSFIGIEYCPSMINGKGFSVNEYTKEQHSLIGSAPQKSRVFGWKNELDIRQIKIFESNCGSLLTYLGYKLEFSKPTLFLSNLSRREWIWMNLKEFILRQHNKIRYLIRKSKA